MIFGSIASWPLSRNATKVQSRGPGELGAGHDGGNRLSLIAIL